MKAATIYLNFDGNCRQAMKFYERCLGGELHMMPFSEMQDGNYPKEAKDRIMHAHLAAGPTTLMASDTMPGGQFKQGNNFSICLNPDSVQELDKLFAAPRRKRQSDYAIAGHVLGRAFRHADRSIRNQLDVQF